MDCVTLTSESFPECFQGGESQVSLSDTTCSESASSFQSVSQTSTPEILVGLVYNATTGRLSVEIIKGIHFKNAANKPPSKYSKAFCLSSPVRRAVMRVNLFSGEGWGGGAGVEPEGWMSRQPMYDVITPL